MAAKVALKETRELVSRPAKNCRSHLKRLCYYINLSILFEMIYKKEESSSMKELMVINHDDSILIDAQLLHQKLQTTSAYYDWIKYRISEYGFKEGEDYFLKKVQLNQKGRSTTIYHLTIDTAKELAMLERNETGRNIRRYFIAAEKEARARQLPGAFSFSRSLKAIDLNGRKLLPYREFLVSIGHTPGGGAYSRKKRYPNHFISFNGIDHVSVELAGIIGMNWLLVRKRKEVKAMQPLLPVEFGILEATKGGRPC